MEIGGGDFELGTSKKQHNIALATNEKKLNLYAKQSYHIQGLNQAKWGFWLSVIGAIGGFIIIVVSLFINSSVIGVVSGVVIEGVSALFFSISNKANERINQSFDKLRLDSNIVNSIELSKSIEDTRVKDELKVKLSLYLIGIDEEKICKNSFGVCNHKNNNDIAN